MAEHRNFEGAHLSLLQLCDALMTERCCICPAAFNSCGVACSQSAVGAQDRRLCSADGTVCLVAQGDGNLVLCAPVKMCWAPHPVHVHQKPILLVPSPDACISCRYNETLVALYGASASTAIFYTGIFGAAADGHPSPYTVSMQAVRPTCIERVYGDGSWMPQELQYSSSQHRCHRHLSQPCRRLLLCRHSQACHLSWQCLPTL